MTPVWPGRAQTARAPPQPRCGNLDERRKEAYLRACGQDRRKEAAYGVDHVRADASEEPLAAPMRDRVERRKGTRDRATRVKRRDSPHGNGQRRPLGRPAVEDQRRQRAVARLLDALDAPDCRRGSDG
jgi:hypothetical protein